MYVVRDTEGKIVTYLDTDEEATAWLATVPPDVYTFFVGGEQEDVDRLRAALNDNGFYEALADKYGRVPPYINPMHEIKEAYIGRNAFYVKISDQQVSNSLLMQLFSVLHDTVSAGSTFYTVLQTQIADDTVTADSVTEGVYPFLAIDDVSESITGVITDAVLKGSVL